MVTRVVEVEFIGIKLINICSVSCDIVQSDMSLHIITAILDVYISITEIHFAG